MTEVHDMSCQVEIEIFQIAPIAQEMILLFMSPHREVNPRSALFVWRISRVGAHCYDCFWFWRGIFTHYDAKIKEHSLEMMEK